MVDLFEDDWDLAVRIGMLPDSSLISRRLSLWRMVVCAAPSYISARGAPQTLGDLSRHNCLG